MGKSIQVNVHDAKTRLSRLLSRVARGDEVVIAKAGRPVARLVSINQTPAPRILGSAKGQVWISDDFNAPLPEDLLKAFEGEE